MQKNFSTHTLDQSHATCNVLFSQKRVRLASWFGDESKPAIASVNRSIPAPSMAALDISHRCSSVSASRVFQLPVVGIARMTFLNCSDNCALYVSSDTFPASPFDDSGSRTDATCVIVINCYLSFWHNMSKKRRFTQHTSWSPHFRLHSRYCQKG